ncbi:Retrotransposon gag protein [Gracilaria domingensis]|nr:Retrotransposon gag protein [Gracilaria domingensis]
MASVNFEELSQARKKEFNHRLKELQEDRNDVMKSVEVASKRVETTKSILASMGIVGSNETSPSSARSTHYRIPNLPSFRGKEDSAIKDPFEFLGKVKIMLLAHEIPSERWIPALLTSLNGYDRQWAEKNIIGLQWDEVHARFLHHFESPAIRDKLLRELMTISQKSSESVQEYSDRFTSLMARTGRPDDDETLVAVYIEGLDGTLQDLMHVARAATLNMCKRTNQGNPPVSIADEIASAITLDSSRTLKRRSQQGSSVKTEGQQGASGKKKRCSICNSRNHPTEARRGRSGNPPEEKNKVLDAATREKLKKENKCFRCKKPWKPEHKCATEEKKEPQAVNLQVKEPVVQDDEGSREELAADADLRAFLGYEDHDPEAQLLAPLPCDDTTPDPTVSALTAAPDDATELLYTQVQIDGIDGWAMVNSGATSTFISSDFVKASSRPRDRELPSSL